MTLLLLLRGGHSEPVNVKARDVSRVVHLWKDQDTTSITFTMSRLPGRWLYVRPSDIVGLVW